MIVKICFNDNNYERLIECDCIHKSFIEDKTYLEFILYKNGALVESPRFRIKEDSGKVCVDNVDIYIMEKGKTVDSVRIRSAK